MDLKWLLTASGCETPLAVELRVAVEPKLQLPENQRKIISLGAYTGYGHHCTVVPVTREAPFCSFEMGGFNTVSPKITICFKVHLNPNLKFGIGGWRAPTCVF